MHYFRVIEVFLETVNDIIMIYPLLSLWLNDSNDGQLDEEIIFVFSLNFWQGVKVIHTKWTNQSFKMLSTCRVDDS